MRGASSAALVAAGFLALAGCERASVRPPESPLAKPGAAMEGVASWYGPGFHGKPTTSGEIYDQYELTAAHQTLPLGTRVEVTNLNNGRSIEVRINDRGPFVGDRLIDLSYAAARQLDMIGPGTAPVRVDLLGPSPAILATSYAVQVGSFADEENAERLRMRLSERFDNVYVSRLDGGSGQYYRVRLGRFRAREEATRQAQQLVAIGLPAVIVEDGAFRR